MFELGWQSIATAVCVLLAGGLLLRRGIRMFGGAGSGCGSGGCGDCPSGESPKDVAGKATQLVELESHIPRSDSAAAKSVD